MKKNIGQLGEFGLINKISKGIKTDKSVVVGIGDDTAVLEYNSKQYLLLTSDMIVEDVDFRLSDALPEEIGWKAICCSVSDIAAMGGAPKWAVISIGLPKKLSLEIINGIYAGIKKSADRFRINIVGGDTSSAEKLIIDVAIAGIAEKKNLVLRSGAKINDAIFVTGTLGGAVSSGKHLRFMPRIQESQVLVNNFKINAMIDISDGLSSDLNHILEMSNAGAVVYAGCLPVTKGASLGAALSEGEDFELLFTVTQKESERLKKYFPRLYKKASITQIGEITKSVQGFQLVDKYGKAKIIRPHGYNHFF